MKNKLTRAFALLLAAALLFSFAACTKGDDGAATTATTAAENALPKGIGETVIKKEFTDPDNKDRVVYTLDLILPSVDKAVFAQGELINICFAEVAEAKEQHANSNIKNAVRWFDAHEDAIPWCIIGRSELTFSNSKYLCFKITFQYGYGTEGKTGNTQCICISTETGKVCRLNDFLAKGVKLASVSDFVCPDVLKRSVNEYKVSTLKPDITTAEAIAEFFSDENFYLTDSGITFYFNPGFIASVDSGIMEYSYTYDEISSLLTLPRA